MKQILVCYKQDRKLRVRCNILSDVFVPVEDVISPQKTTLTVPKNDLIELGDIIIIKDNNSGKIEYIGYIDTLENKVNTEMSCYPLINVFDNDFVLDQMFKTVKKGSYNSEGVWVESATETEDVDVDAVEWLATQIKRAFIDTKDDLQALPLKFPEDLDEGAGYGTKTLVFYKKALDTANLFEVYIDLFINTGLYVVFTDLVYERNEITGIMCEIRCNKDERMYRIYEHDPTVQKAIITDNTFNNYNKLIYTEELAEGETREPTRFYFYLLNTNEITTEPNDAVRIQKEEAQGLPKGSLGRRIKQVRTKAMTFTFASDDGQKEKNAIDAEVAKRKEELGRDLTDDEKKEAKDYIQAKALVLAVYNELQSPEYDLKVEIEMLKNDNLFLYRNIDFVSNKVYNEDGKLKNVIYTSNITKIERLNEKQVRITLGALRNSLTDFKKKVEAI